MEKQRYKKILALFLALSMVLSTSGIPGVYGDTSSQDPLTPRDGGVVFSAGMYTDADRTNLDTMLTKEGATLEDWVYQSSSASSEDRYLGITLAGLDMYNTQYRVVVEMDPILYVNMNSEPTLTDATVSYEKNADFTVSTTGLYPVHKYSFSNLTYLIDPGVSGLTIGLPIRFDQRLWNKQNGGLLGNGERPLLRVYLEGKQGTGEFDKVEDYDVALQNATVKGSLKFSPTFNSYVNGNQTSIMGVDDKVRGVFAQFGANNAANGHYAKDVQVKIKLPTCVINETKYDLVYEGFNFVTSNGEPAVQTTVETDSSGNVVYTFSGSEIYFTGSSMFQIYFAAPEALKNVDGTHDFKGSIAVTEDGVTVCSAMQIAIRVEVGGAPILVAGSASGLANTVDTDTVQFLGTLSMRNDSAKNDSGPLMVKLAFDTNNTNAVGISTINIMKATAVTSIKVDYTLVDENGEPAFLDEATGENKIHSVVITAARGSYRIFSRGDLPAEHQKYYFKTVSYVLDNLPANTYAYNKSAVRSPSSGGTFWGYVKTTVVPSIKPKHTIEVYRVGEESPAITGSTVTDINNGTSSSYGLTSATVSKTYVQAGDSVTIGGTIDMATYPYSSNNCLDDIRIGLILPEGVTPNAAGIKATGTGGTLAAKSVQLRSDINVGVNKNYYVIEFASDYKIGLWNEKLKPLPGGATLKVQIQLNSEKTVSSQTILLRECMFVAGYQRANAAGGSYSEYAVADIYDLNGNGKTTDKIGKFRTSVTASVTFDAVPAELAITDELINAKDESGQNMTTETFADVLDYNLRIACTEGGTASDFYYIIPIPKTTMTMETDFVQKCDVDLFLKDKPTFTTTDGTPLKLVYTTTPVKNYAEALGVTDWSETLPDGKTWDDVTLIKVVASDANTVIANGSVTNVSVPLGFSKDLELDYIHMAGYQIQWSSRGYYCYEVGHNNNSGIKSTDGVLMTLTYSAKDPIRFTLTAAKGGTPTGADASATASFYLHEFYLAQTYSVREITPYNVNLMNQEYDFTKANSAEANTNFRIKVSVKKRASETASTPIALQKNNDIIGSLAGNSAPEFTFSIENADALSDIVTDRKVTLTLIGSNGIIIPVEITIKRELATAEPTKSAIVQGEIYAPFDEGTNTTVSRDSAFTAQFVTEYIPANYKDRIIHFEKAPIAGTKITLVDYTKPAELGFYHYTLNGSEKDIELINFTKMGSTQKYKDPSITDIVTERLLFVVAYPKEGESLMKNKMTLTKVIRTGTDSLEPSTLTFETLNERAFTMNASKNNVLVGKSFSVDYTSQCSVSDSRYDGRTMSLVIKPKDGTKFPSDAKIMANGVGYSLTSQGIFLLPLRAAQMGDGSITLSYQTRAETPSVLEISLWASATANGLKPLMGDQVLQATEEVQVSPLTKPSFKVTNITKRLLKEEDLQRIFTVEFDKRQAEKVTVELQEKISADYVTQTTAIEAVNGKTEADEGQGVFEVTGNKADFELNDRMREGTYRFLFKVYSEDTMKEIPYNFIILRQ
ncbi:MAG: hypothetical protein IKJ77_07575 [Firmicutes bacterium]|nr:hypothetical protein [Bacillota bacterium]